MSDVNVSTGINLDELQAELGKMSPDELMAELIELKSRQKLATKKYSGNPETAKRYRDKQAALKKLMEQKAKELGIADKIEAEAKKIAEEKFAKWKADRQAEAAQDADDAADDDEAAAA